MKHINFLLSSVSEEENLDSLAVKFFSIVHVNNFEERSSTHYVDERYFIGRNGNMEFKVMLSDDADNADLPFWVRLSVVDRDEDLKETEIHNLVHASLLPSGFRVARMENFGQVGEQRIDY